MRAKRPAPDQLPLWEAPANNPDGIVSLQAQEPESVEAMRAYIMQWGEKNGGMHRGRDRYEQELARHKQQERYAGEWEDRCIEQLHRYDAGICEKLWLWLPEYGFPSERTAEDEE